MRVLLVVAAVLAAGCAAQTPPRSAPGSPTTPAGDDGNVAGVVLAAPACPVERPGSPCPPRVVAGAAVDAYRGNIRVAQTDTDARGRFRLTLAAGTYRIAAHNVAGYPSAADSSVAVTAGATTAVTLTVDSGIR